MSKDLKGVVVRFPLSDSDRRLVRLSYSGSMNSDEAFDKAILAIGTPVMGGELDVVGYAHCVNGKIVTLGTYRAPDVSDGISVTSEPLVRQTALAAARAEIVKLTEENERLKHIAYSGRGSLSYTIHSPARFADEERKGPAA